MQGLLRKEVTLLNRFPNVGFVAPEFYLVNNNGDIILHCKSSFINNSHMIVPGRQFLEYFMLGEPVFGTHSIVWTWPSVMMRKKLILDVGKFSLNLDTSLADSWILYRLSLISDFCQICEPLFKFMSYAHSEKHAEPFRQSSSREGRVFDESLWLVRETIEFANENNIVLNPRFEKKALEHLAKLAVSFNGAISWTGARFEGSYISRASKIIEIFHRCIRMNPYILCFVYLARISLLARYLLPEKTLFTLAQIEEHLLTTRLIRRFGHVVMLHCIREA